MDDEMLRQAILSAVTTRGAGKTICPSEVARTMATEWRDIMPDVRRAGQSLADEARLLVTQRGQPVNAVEAKGPIRFGLPVSTG